MSAWEFWRALEILSFIDINWIHQQLIDLKTFQRMIEEDDVKLRLIFMLPLMVSSHSNHSNRILVTPLPQFLHCRSVHSLIQIFMNDWTSYYGSKRSWERSTSSSVIFQYINCPRQRKTSGKSTCSNHTHALYGNFTECVKTWKKL